MEVKYSLKIFTSFFLIFNCFKWQMMEANIVTKRVLIIIFVKVTYMTMIAQRMGERNCYEILTLNMKQYNTI